MKVIIRGVTASDHNFIFATYIHNKWFDKANKTTLKKASWCAIQHRRLERILAEEKVLVACLDEDNDFVLGYVFLDNKEPFTYLKKSYRAEGLGIEGRLIKEIVK